MPQSRVYVSFIEEVKVVPFVAGHPSSAVACAVLLAVLAEVVALAVVVFAALTPVKRKAVST